MSHKPKSYAILPAAGRSTRMGQPKLLLPWPKSANPSAVAFDECPTGYTLIDHVLNAWTASRVDEVVVIVRVNDEALLDACRRWKVSIVQPSFDPRDMKESVQHGLRYLQKRNPNSFDTFLVAPADLPTITPQIIDRLIEVDADESTIVVPVFGDRASHPVRLPWSLSQEIFQLAKNEGVDRVVAQHPQLLVEFPAEELVDDVDTPIEYQAAFQKAVVDLAKGPAHKDL